MYFDSPLGPLPGIDRCSTCNSMFTEKVKYFKVPIKTKIGDKVTVEVAFCDHNCMMEYNKND